MKSNSECEPFPAPLNAGTASTRCSPIVILVILAVSLLVASPVTADVSLTEMARLEAAGPGEAGRVLALFRGYAALGLQAEAAEILERGIHLGEIRVEDTAPLFERAALEESRWNDPERLSAISETALRNGVRTPRILYAYATALRMSGRLSDARTILVKIGPESPLYPFALYALGQIAAQEGNEPGALEFLDRLRVFTAGKPEIAGLSDKAARSQAEWLLLLGRRKDAAIFFETLLRKREDPLARFGLAASSKDVLPDEEGVPAGAIAGWPARERVLLSLFRGGIARERARYGEAIRYLAQGEKDLEAFLGSPGPVASDPVDRTRDAELLARQIDRHRSLRQLLSSSSEQGDPESIRSMQLEMLVELLFMDRQIARSSASLSSPPSDAQVLSLPEEQVSEILLRIEEVALDGVSVDRMVQDLTRKLDVMQNLAHPIQRFRLLTRLEKSLTEINTLKEKITRGRRGILAAHARGEAVTDSRLLQDVGRFLRELKEFRPMATESQEFIRQNLSILRRRKEIGVDNTDLVRETARETLAFDDERFTKILPLGKELEARGRAVSWERKKQEMVALRPVIARQFFETHLAAARSKLGNRSTVLRQEGWTSLEQAASFLAGERFSRRETEECALQVAAVVAGRGDRWETYPERATGESESRIIDALLPRLVSHGESGARREEARYLVALLRMMRKDPAGAADARDFLARFPSSPLGGNLAVRLGNQALLSGNAAEAMNLYRRAASGGYPEAAYIGQYMIGWSRFRSGDSQGAARELSGPLSDPSFQCDDPSSFERAVLALAVRAWQDAPLESLETYPPVRDSRCGGTLLLTALGEAEEKRGETGRASTLYDVLARRFSGEAAAFAFEKKSIEDLSRSGKTDEALSRTLTLREKYGPGSAWAKAQTPAVQQKTRAEIVDLLRDLSERAFEEGIGSGDDRGLSKAAAGLEQYFGLMEGAPTLADDELRLKWAVASLRSGNRAKGIALLEELSKKTPSGPPGERAALLYADTRITGYERGEWTAQEAEDATLLLLKTYPSDKAVSMAFRAAMAFLETGGDHERASRIAGAIEASPAASIPQRRKARLVRAESALARNDTKAARETAGAVLEESRGDGDPKVSEQARNLFLLASLKEIDAETGRQELATAASMLEDLGRRFPDAPESPAYLLRAFRLDRTGGDAESALRVGNLFLQRYPRREESMEVAEGVGGLLEEKGEYLKAADLYAEAAERFPRTGNAPRLLFRSARLSNDHDDSGSARKRFTAFRTRYPAVRWMNAYAALSLGILDWQGKNGKTATREFREGFGILDKGVETEAPPELRELAGKARIAMGEVWAEQFREVKLVIPLEKSLARKDQFFRRALEEFGKAQWEATLEVSVTASRSSGDLFLEFGKAILSSQRPKGMTREDGETYENALAARARTYFKRALDWYSGSLERLGAEEGSASLAMPIRQRMQEAQRLMAGNTSEPEKP